jgi:hypothetical protein
MPWYSNIGLVIAGIGALGFVYDFYQNYKKRTIPIMEAVYLVESYLKKKNVKIRYNTADVVFWDSDSIYSSNIKGIMLLIFKACKEGKLNLFGKQGGLPEIKIEHFEINENKVHCPQKKYLPQINNSQGNPIFVDLTLEKKGLVEWIKILAVN